jgi:hypothetical protein
MERCTECDGPASEPDGCARGPGCPGFDGCVPCKHDEGGWCDDDCRSYGCPGEHTCC